MADDAADRPAGASSAGRGFSIAAFIMGAVSIIFLPIVFGPAGIALGLVGNAKGDPLGKTAAIASAVAMVIGFAVGYFVFTEVVQS